MTFPVLAAAKRIAMIDPIKPEFSQANADMADLIRLAKLYGFALFEYMSLLSDVGAPALCCQVDDVPTTVTGGRVAHYKLSEALRVILTALRAGNFGVGQVKLSASRRRAFADAASPTGFTGGQGSSPSAEDQG